MTAIQPCSLLLLVGPDWQVETASANVAMLGNFKPATLIGQPLADLIGSKAIHTLRNRLSWLAGDESEVQDFGVEWGGVTLDIRATRGEHHYLIEAELAVEPRLPDGIGMVRSMTDRLSGSRPQELAEQAMRQLCSLTGFEHFMLYDQQARVIALAGGDLPALAEANAARTSVPSIIADREAEPVPVLGNMSRELLRRAAFLAPSANELEAMRESGVAAAMHLPIRIDGKMVAWLNAYHSEPRRCGAERRSVAHLFAERLVARMARHGWTP